MPNPGKLREEGACPCYAKQAPVDQRPPDSRKIRTQKARLPGIPQAAHVPHTGLPKVSLGVRCPATDNGRTIGGLGAAEHARDQRFRTSRGKVTTSHEPVR